MNGFFFSSPTMKQSIIFLGVLILTLCIICSGEQDNKARYDNYRVYRLVIKTEQQLQIFQEIEKSRDSYAFFGHPKRINQRIKVMVAAQKIPEISEILLRYDVEHQILVNILLTFFPRNKIH